MADLTDLAPIDDAFIRTAIRGLRAPDHHPAFWGELAGELDAAEDALDVPRPPARPAPEPLVVPLPEPDPDPVPEPVPAPAVEVHPPRREPLRARPPAHAAPAGAERVRAFVAAPAAPSPKPVVVVHHDPAVVPQSLRRSSNAVLLAIAVLAAVVALVAGLTLVRQRSDASAPDRGPTPADVGAVAAD